MRMKGVGEMLRGRIIHRRSNENEARWIIPEKQNVWKYIGNQMKMKRVG